MLADHFGEGVIMSIAMIIAAITLSMVVLGTSTIILFVATALFGMACALFGTARLTAVYHTYPDNRGTAIGLISAGGDIGNTVLPLVAGILAAVFMWEFGFGYTIPLFLLAGISLWFVVPNRTSTLGNSSVVVSIEYAKVVKSGILKRPVVLIVTIQLLGTSIWQAFTGFYPLYLMEMKGLSPFIASGLFALFFAMGAFLKPTSGFAYDRFGPRKVLLILMTTSGTGLLLLPIIVGFWPLVFTTAVIAAMGGRGTICLSYMTEEIPDDILNTGLGTVRTIYMSIGAISPTLLGVVAEAGYFNEGFFMLAATAGLAIVCVLLLSEH